jgi:hypothetical protein
MAKNLNDNIRVYAGKPLDAKYLNTSNIGYTSASAANTAISVAERHVGLTVLVNNIEYWYKDGVADANLVVKQDVITDYISGATNVGYFSGYYGIQTLPLNHLTDNTFDGNYVSLYNNYYRGTDGIIHVGTPSDGINKRAYVKSTGTVRTWIWNERVASGDLLGWTFIDGDVSELIGTYQSASLPRYYNSITTFPYTQTSWTNGIGYVNGSDITVDAVVGSLVTGNTYTNGVRPYSFKENRVLNFKTLVTKTPSLINFTEDEAFIYFSGTTFGGENIGSSGVGVFSGVNDRTFQYKKLVGSGDTTVFSGGDTVVIFTSSLTGVTTIDTVDVTGATYFATALDEYFGVSGTTGSSLIYLYDTPKKGQRAIISDIAGNAETYPITVFGNGININNETSFLINTNYGSITLIYNNHFWNLINP